MSEKCRQGRDIAEAEVVARPRSLSGPTTIQHVCRLRARRLRRDPIERVRLKLVEHVYRGWMDRSPTRPREASPSA